ncbi:MAG: TrkA family potassium uptake protein [Chloroflexi bacterium]|nr:TrkA family potassium uptake protein [Chloroflexota bacterium]
MFALIIGGGRVGSAVAKNLLREGWEVTVVDENKESLLHLGEDYSGGFILGPGLDIDILMEAGIDRADVFVASTDGDNTNLVISQIAGKRFKVPYVVARVQDPNRAQFYSDQLDIMTVSPTLTTINMLLSGIHSFERGEA